MVSARALRLAEKAAWDAYRLHVRGRASKRVHMGDDRSRELYGVWKRARAEYMDAIGVPRRMANITAKRRHKRRMEA